jgi:hypothetical protein
MWVSKYQLKTDSGTTYHLYVTEMFNFSNPQSVVKYEVAGRSGGLTIHTGARTKTINVRGKLVISSLAPQKFFVTREVGRRGRTRPVVKIMTPEQVKINLEELADSGTPVSFITPKWDGKSNKYLIEDFSGEVRNPTSIDFEMKLAEYAQANVRKKAINLVNYSPAQNLISILRQRGVA